MPGTLSTNRMGFYEIEDEIQRLKNLFQVTYPVSDGGVCPPESLEIIPGSFKAGAPG